MQREDEQYVPSQRRGSVLDVRSLRLFHLSHDRPRHALLCWCSIAIFACSNRDSSSKTMLGNQDFSIELHIEISSQCLSLQRRRHFKSSKHNTLFIDSNLIKRLVGQPETPCVSSIYEDFLPIAPFFSLLYRDWLDSFSQVACISVWVMLSKREKI